jgi:hypothetical protein
MRLNESRQDACNRTKGRKRVPKPPTRIRAIRAEQLAVMVSHGQTWSDMVRLGGIGRGNGAYPSF